jgi:hypothetical protein
METARYSETLPLPTHPRGNLTQKDVINFIMKMYFGVCAPVHEARVPYTEFSFSVLYTYLSFPLHTNIYLFVTFIISFMMFL